MFSPKKWLQKIIRDELQVERDRYKYGITTDSPDLRSSAINLHERSAANKVERLDHPREKAVVEAYAGLDEAPAWTEPHIATESVPVLSGLTPGGSCREYPIAPITGPTPDVAIADAVAMFDRAAEHRYGDYDAVVVPIDKQPALACIVDESEAVNINKFSNRRK